MAGALNPVLAYGAGVLTILSPCVLPLVPIVLGAAAQKHRFGPLALAGGLVASFTIVGFLVAAGGAAIGLEAGWVRGFGAVLLVGAGILLLAPPAQAVLATGAGPLVAWAGDRQASLDRYGLAGQAGIGVLLGLVWSPCVGPTLGAATVLAAQGDRPVEVLAVMAAFGAGIATVLLLFAFVARGALTRWRGRMMAAGARGKALFGVVLVAVGAMILTGLDRSIEATLVDASPDWLVSLSTRL